MSSFFRFRRPSPIPGFGLTLGYTAFFLVLVVVVPLGALVVKSAGIGFGGFARMLLDERTLLAFRLTVSVSLVAALLNAVFGFVVAWFLVRVPFPGKRVIDALVDLPFALPTAVSGIALTAVYSGNGWIGAPLGALGIEAAFTPLGIVLALVLVGLPFTVRTVQPALEDLELELEEAAASLGAGKRQTFFRVILPVLLPPILTGFSLAFARGLGEYGTVVFIAGNMPMKTEMLSLLIVTKLEQHDVEGASAIAAAMLALSFLLLLAINGLQSWTRRRMGGEANG